MKYCEFIDSCVTAIAEKIKDEFDESKHPRDDAGKWTSKGAGSSTGKFKPLSAKQLSKLSGVDERYIKYVTYPIELGIREGYPLSEIAEYTNDHNTFTVGYTPSEKLNKYIESYAENYERELNESTDIDLTKDSNLRKATSSIDRALMYARRRGYIYGDTDIQYDPKSNKLNIIFSVNREFRHPDEYYSAEELEYDTPEAIQKFNSWQSKLQSRIDTVVKRNKLNGANIHG